MGSSCTPMLVCCALFVRCMHECMSLLQLQLCVLSEGWQSVHFLEWHAHTRIWLTDSGGGGRGSHAASNARPCMLCKKTHCICHGCCVLLPLPFTSSISSAAAAIMCTVWLHPECHVVMFRSKYRIMRFAKANPQWCCAAKQMADINNSCTWSVHPLRVLDALWEYTYRACAGLLTHTKTGTLDMSVSCSMTRIYRTTKLLRSLLFPWKFHSSFLLYVCLSHLSIFQF